jgi:hypothetical protein
MNELLANTVFPNLAIIIFSLGALFFIAKWLRSDVHTEDGKTILAALCFMVIGVIIDSSWWGLAHFIHGIHTEAGTFFEDYKGVKAITVALCWGWGTISMINIFEHWHRYTKIMVFAGVFVLAYVASAG